VLFRSLFEPLRFLSSDCQFDSPRRFMNNAELDHLSNCILLLVSSFLLSVNAQNIDNKFCSHRFPRDAQSNDPIVISRGFKYNPVIIEY
jgi:hypothetical protein